MIISSFEGALKPSAMQHKNNKTSQLQSEATGLFANFDFVLNFIQNIIDNTQNLQQISPKNNLSNIEHNRLPISDKLQSLLQISESSDITDPKIIMDKSIAKILQNLNLENIEKLDKTQLQALIKLVNNNEQVNNNILKYIPKEILEYFKTNFDKNNNPLINFSQIQSQISDISKSKITDLKIIDQKFEPELKKEKIFLKIDNNSHQESSPNYIKNDSNNLKQTAPIISDNAVIKENIKQIENNINQKSDNQIDIFVKKEVIINHSENNLNPQGKENFDKTGSGEVFQTTNKTEKDGAIKDAKNVFTLTSPSFMSTRIADNQAVQQVFNNVRTEELPELTNKFIQIIGKEGTLKANISLYPENLGMLFVQITMKDGGITMTIRTEKSATLDKIGSSIANLINNFNDQGLKVENIKLLQDNTASSEENFTGRKGDNQEQKDEYQKEYLQFLLKTRHFKINNV